MTTTYKSHIVPAGKYLLGDPCYVIRDKDWLDFCNQHSYNETDNNACVTLNDSTQVVAFSTYYGDGCYTDQNGNSFPVDAGLIGLVPISYIEESTQKNLTDYRDLCTLVEFEEDALCFTVDGILTFGNYIIDTK